MVGKGVLHDQHPISWNMKKHLGMQPTLHSVALQSQVDYD